MTIKRRLEALEQRRETTGEEHLVFYTTVGDETRCAIYDIKRGRSAQNTDQLPVREFLRVTGEEWGLDLQYHYDTETT